MSFYEDLKKDNLVKNTEICNSVDKKLIEYYDLNISISVHQIKETCERYSNEGKRVLEGIFFVLRDDEGIESFKLYDDINERIQQMKKLYFGQNAKPDFTVGKKSINVGKVKFSLYSDNSKESRDFWIRKISDELKQDGFPDDVLYPIDLSFDVVHKYSFWNGEPTEYKTIEPIHAIGVKIKW